MDKLDGSRFANLWDRAFAREARRAAGAVGARRGRVRRFPISGLRSQGARDTDEVGRLIGNVPLRRDPTHDETTVGGKAQAGELPQRSFEVSGTGTTFGGGKSEREIIHEREDPRADRPRVTKLMTEGSS